MTFTLAQLAERLGARVDGDGSVAITGVAPIENAGPGQLSFLANPKYADHLRTTGAAAVIVAPDLFGVPRAEVARGAALLIHDNPYFTFLQALTLFHPPPPSPPPGVDQSARIGHRVRLGDRVHVGPMCVIDDEAELRDGAVILAGSFVGARSVIGADSMIGPHVTILPGCTLGARVRIHPGTVIGSDGFGYAPVNGKHEKIPQVGGVTIGDDVEIGACCAIDRATMGQTVIGRGTKIDNLVQIAHNVQIGEDCIIVSQVGISGSTKLGNHVTLAGQVGLIGHIELGDNVIVAAQSGIVKDLPPNTIWLGSPAGEMAHQKRVIAATHSLPETLKRLRELEKRVAELEARQK
ncbi:MAG TPA: UDP-3-O-(3-hydroxymyristoyl)glucosamine N-acyltransferase [bacterium]|nr:UDP-3-O-(3-hydroxymyristoyl)glucosamine N-acyltransferase [bacterium]